MMTDDFPDTPPTPAEQVKMLFVWHEGAIRAFVRALQPSLGDADDVLQETFFTVSRKAASFEPGTNFVAWACGIARLKVLESFRQRKRANVLSEAVEIEVSGLKDGNWTATTYLFDQTRVAPFIGKKPSSGDEEGNYKGFPDDSMSEPSLLPTGEIQCTSVDGKVFLPVVPCPPVSFAVWTFERARK